MTSLSSTIVRISLIAAAVAGLAACSPGGGGPSPAAADTSKDADAIRAGEVQWNQDYKTHALEALVGHYAHDAVVMVPGQPTANGSDAIRAALTDIQNDPKFTLTFAPDKVVVAASGDIAYTTGKYSQTATDPKTHKVVHETGGYVTVYHKATDGAWKAVADINTPGPAAP
jgi:uncharacterized protein (TIGR02246 family)